MKNMNNTIDDAEQNIKKKGNKKGLEVFSHPPPPTTTTTIPVRTRQRRRHFR